MLLLFRREMVMKEKELLGEIENVVRNAEGLTSALTRIKALIGAYCGGAVLAIRPESFGRATSTPPPVLELLESREFPFRGLYFAPVSYGSGPIHTFIACLGTWGISADSLRRITTFTAQQLSELISRLGIPVTEYAEAA